MATRRSKPPEAPRTVGPEPVGTPADLVPGTDGAAPGGGSGRRTTAAYVERKAEILGVAGQVFFEKSYHAASMQDIADRAGILKAGLYYYFTSKEELLFELAAGETVRNFIDFLAAGDEALQGRDAPTRLRAFLARWIENIGPRKAAFMAVERDFRELSPERLRDVIAVRRRVPEMLESIIERGVEEGSFDPGILVPVAVKDISAMITTMYSWYRPTGESTLSELVDWHIDFILRGLGVPVAPRKAPARGRQKAATRS